MSTRFGLTERSYVLRTGSYETDLFVMALCRFEDSVQVIASAGRWMNIVVNFRKKYI